MEKLFKAAFQEAINEISVGSKTADEVLDAVEAKISTHTTIFRWVSWFMSIFGHWLLFEPIIKLLKFIPLVGGLLGSIMSFAAGIFALVWATLLHLLILALAWIAYRPLIGLLLLSGVALMIVLLHKNKSGLGAVSPKM